MIANSTALAEQLARRARTLNQDSVEVPVLLIGRDEARHDVIERVRVTRLPGDSLAIGLDPQNRIRAAFGSDGHLQGAIASEGAVRIVRLH